jgi:predicted nucleic-acid-binding protein
VRAVDTNVVVRYLTNDDPAQAARARAAVDAGDIFVPVSVILETEWVLRSGGYGFTADRIIKAVRSFARLPSVTLEHAHRVERALEWAERGLDFADALHLASAKDCREMLSFDRKFVRAAAQVSDLRVSSP